MWIDCFVIVFSRSGMKTTILTLAWWKTREGRRMTACLYRFYTRQTNKSRPHRSRNISHKTRSPSRYSTRHRETLRTRIIIKIAKTVRGKYTRQGWIAEDKEKTFSQGTDCGQYSTETSLGALFRYIINPGKVKLHKVGFYLRFRYHLNDGYPVPTDNSFN